MERNYLKSVNTGTKTISVKLFLCTMLICISVGTLILGICFLVIKPKTEPIIDYLYDDSDLPEYDGLVYTQVAGGYCVSAKDKTAQKVVIPAEYNGQPVIKISDNAFSESKSLTSVTIPDSVIDIGSGAFNNCPITKATVPAAACSAVANGLVDNEGKLEYKLKNVIITSGTKIPSNVFLFCKNLTSIIIPKTITDIGEDAFYKPESFEKCLLFEIKYEGDIKSWCAIDGLDSLMCYGDSDRKLFINDKEIKGKLVIPSGVVSINSCAFYGCKLLTNVSIPDTVTYIGYNAFCRCKSLKQMSISQNVTSMNAFCGCSSLTNIVIPNSVKSIDMMAFDGCSSLKNIIIPNSVEEIGTLAFFNCKSLTTAIIPMSVTRIGYNAFSYCESLTICCEVTKQPSGWESDWNGDNRPVIWGYQPE